MSQKKLPISTNLYCLILKEKKLSRRINDKVKQEGHAPWWLSGEIRDRKHLGKPHCLFEPLGTYTQFKVLYYLQPIYTHLGVQYGPYILGNIVSPKWTMYRRKKKHTHTQQLIFPWYHIINELCLNKCFSLSLHKCKYIINQFQ